jgi:hypothetical protein
MHGLCLCAVWYFLDGHAFGKAGSRISIFRLILCAFLALISNTSQAQLPSPSLWLSSEDILSRLDTATNQLYLSVAASDFGRIQALAAMADGEVWVAGDKRLVMLAADGTTQRELDLKSLGLEGEASLLLNPYDQGIWIASGKNLLHLDASGQLVGRGVLPSVGRAAILGLDEHVWVLGNKEVWRYSRQGKLVASQDLHGLIKEEPKLLAVDSLHNRLWLAGEKQLVQLDLNAPSRVSWNLPLPRPAQALSLDERSGVAWVLMEGLLTAYRRDGTAAAAIELKTLQIEHASVMAFDPISRSLWLGHRHGLARLSETGELQALFSSEEPIERLGVAPLIVTPTLSLIQPLEQAWTSDSMLTITLGLDAACFDVPCGLGAEHSKSYTIDALLNNSPIGSKFQFNPDTEQANYLPDTRLAEGQNVFSAQAADRFGHSSNMVKATFTVDTIPPRFLAVSPSDGGVLTEPQVTISGKVDEDAWVLFNGLANTANGFNADFSFQVMLEPGANTLYLSAHDKVGNSGSMDLHLIYVPDVSLAVSIDSPTPGANIAGDRVLVSGTFQGPPNTGITVNGIVASQNGNRFYASVPLVSSANTLTAIATRPDGNSATQSISISSSGTSLFSVSVEPASGIAPLKTAFLVWNNANIQISKIQIDFDGDGTVDFTTADLGARIETTYVTPGVYPARIMVTDSSNNVHGMSQFVVVKDITKLDAMLRGVYTGMLSMLRQGNIDAALAYVTGGVHDKYKAVFNALKPTLATMVDQLGDIQDGSISGEMAEYVIVRNAAAGPQAFLIYFILGEDGVWRIDGM